MEEELELNKTNGKGWVRTPNRIYDNMSNINRFFFAIFLLMIALTVSYLTTEWFFMGFLGFIAVYRSIYFLLPQKKEVEV